MNTAQKNRCASTPWIAIPCIKRPCITTARSLLNFCCILAFCLFTFYFSATQNTFAATDEKAHQDHENEQTITSESHDEHDEKILLSNQQQQNAGIELAQADAETINETIPLYGLVSVNHERVQKLSARFPGVIRSIKVALGDKVKPGDVLATIESNESLKSYELKASIAGVVIERNATLGDLTTDAPLLVIADLSSVWIELSVFPRDLARVHSGQSVRIEQAQQHFIAQGTLDYIAPMASPINQAVTARVTLDNPQGQWLPGHFVKADVTLAATNVAVAVRNEALQTLEGNTVIFVQTDKGFETRQVRIGRADKDFTEIREGVTAQESYVSRNSFVLKSDLGKENAEHEH